MQTQQIETEIVNQCLEILEKAGFQISVPLSTSVEARENQLETVLITLRTLNARYDKNEAINQIQHLMERFNIQLDQLIDKHGI